MQIKNHYWVCRRYLEVLSRVRNENWHDRERYINYYINYLKFKNCRTLHVKLFRYVHNNGKEEKQNLY